MIQTEEAKVALEWKVGDVILDTYEVKQIHEGGGMGLVYRVYHRDWREDLAVKSPRPEFFSSQTQKENFVRECITWIGLGLHPHIVTCYYVRLLGGIPRVFAEYVEGGTLKDWIRARKFYEGNLRQALQRMLDVAIQFVCGLHYAHEKGVIHQDVKPANVMITPEGVVKVTDFGLAKARVVSREIAAVKDDPSILASFGGGYTPAYCSPEQARGDRLTRRTDVWSWGVSVLEMFTGHVFWPSGTTVLTSLESYLENGPQDDAIPRMPDGLAELLRECFRTVPEERPKDMQVVAERLNTIYRSVLQPFYMPKVRRLTEASADVLNNQGVGFYNLGLEDEGGKCFAEAVKADPMHLEATYNRGLYLWRAGKIMSDEVIRQLMNAAKSRSEDPTADYMIGLIHLERGDDESAVRIAESAEGIPSSEIGRALIRYRSGRARPQRLQLFLADSIAISPDARKGLSGGKDMTLQLWDLATGQCLRTFEGHTRSVASVAISPDGRWGLSGSEDKTLRLWDLKSGQCLLTFEGHTSRVTSVAISPDGRWGLSGSWDNTLRLWDLASGQCLRTFEGHTVSVTSVAISPDGRWGLSGSWDNTLRLWDLASGQCLRTFEGHTKLVTSVAISPDGRWGLSGSEDKTLRLWYLESGQCLRPFEGHTNVVTSVAISPDARWGLSGSDDETLRLWDLANNRCLRIFEQHSSPRSVAISADGRWGFSLSWKTLQSWDFALLGYRCAMTPIKPGRPHELLKQHDQFVWAVEAAEAHLQEMEYGAALQMVKEARVAYGYERNVRVMSVLDRLVCHCRKSGITQGWPLRSFEGHKNELKIVAFSPDGNWGLSGSLDKTLRLWNLTTGECLHILQGHLSEVASAAISSNCHYGLSGSSDKTLRLWDLANGQCLRTFEGHASYVTSVAIGPDGRWGLSGSLDKTLRLWNLTNGQCLRTFEGHAEAVNAVAISPDGRWGLSGCSDRTLRLWDLANGQCLRSFMGHIGCVKAVAISSNGRWGLSGSWDKTLRLWDLADGQCLRTFNGHTDAVNSVVISSDGRWGLSGGWDRTLRLWDLASGQCLCTLEGHTDDVDSVAISPEGRWALSGSKDKTFRLWQLDWDYEFPGWVDWDERARSYLTTFLTLHCPVGPDGFTRTGKPAWNESDFQRLISDLQNRGYGWLRPVGVRRELEKMAKQWKGPPSIAGT